MRIVGEEPEGTIRAAAAPGSFSSRRRKKANCPGANQETPEDDSAVSVRLWRRLRPIRSAGGQRSDIRLSS